MEVKGKAVKLLADSALGFSKIAANSKCMCIFHQPAKPDTLSKLAKFDHE